jgi:hypothetical protein
MGMTVAVVFVMRDLNRERRSRSQDTGEAGHGYAAISLSADRADTEQ